MTESPVLVEEMSANVVKRDLSLSEVCLLEGSASLGGESMDSFQPMHSLLLCPAQWSALLESPISLVRHSTDSLDEGEQTQDGMSTDGDEVVREGCSPIAEQQRLTTVAQKSDSTQLENEEEDEKIEEDNQFSTSDSDALLLTPVDTESIEGEESHQMMGKLEEILEEAEEDAIEMGGSVSISEGSVDLKSLKSVSDDKRSEDSSSGLNLSHVLRIYPSTHTSGGSTEGACTINGPCDSTIRGVDTPNGGDKSSVPPTPSSDSRLSFSLIPSHMSHSRNISETPSLPPFINSSTSSAYHSRNSSLASQITSEWFDSDSHSTDIDSCIVMHHELHRPISLQDPKFKLPDFNPMDSKHRQCYSFTDLSSPLHLPDNLFLPSPEFEDTLRTSEGAVGKEDTVHTESFEQKHMACAMKSSEWIKRELRRAKSSMVQVKVSSKTRHVVHFNVKAGDMFIWEFATKRKDIGFGLRFEPTEIATEEQNPEEDPEKPPLDKKVVAILPTLRVNAHAHPTVGSHTATLDGVYEILFDNSYSRFFAKDLFYRITTKPRIPNDNYLDQ